MIRRNLSFSKYGPYLNLSLQECLGHFQIMRKQNICRFWVNFQTQRSVHNEMQDEAGTHGLDFRDISHVKASLV